MTDKRKIEEELNFKDLLKNPVRLFGWIFPIFFVVILLLGIYFVKNLNQISFNEQAVGAVDTTNVKKPIEFRMGSISASVDLKQIKNPTADFIAKGKSLFESTCKACHGDKGLGDGPGGAMLNPRPRNFTATNGWTNGRNFDEIFKTLQEGIAKNGMAAYEFMPAQDRIAIISYIRTLAQFPAITDEQIKSLDQKYQLSKGTVLPSHLPVDVAEDILVSENSALNDGFVKFENKLKQNLPGSELLKKTSNNYQKVWTSFYRLGKNAGSDKFISTVVADPINCGFSPVVLQLSNDEWKILYDFLKTASM